MPKANIEPLQPFAYRVAQVCELTSLRRDHVHALVKRRVIPMYRQDEIGRSILIPAWAVESFRSTGEWQHRDFKPERWDEFHGGHE